MGRGRIAIVLVSGACAAGHLACDDSVSKAPPQDPDNLTTDVDATTQAAGPMPDGAILSFDPGEDAGGVGYGYGYGSQSDAYAPLAWCKQCACAAGTYCFGGAAGYTSFDGVCDHQGGALGIGCNTPPAGCDASDCVCMLQALAPTLGCYGECAGTTPPSIYCQSP